MLVVYKRSKMFICDMAKYLTILSLVCASVIGCFNITSNVSNDAKLWGQYEYGKDYILLIDVFLIKNNDDSEKNIALVPPRLFKSEPGRSCLLIAPNTIQEYQIDPKKAALELGKDKVIGIIKAGTIIQTTLLQKHQGFGLWFGFYKTLSPYAKVINGEFKGLVVNIHDLSIIYSKTADGYIYRPDKTILRKKE